MTYILNPKTQKYDIFITIPSGGIKKPKTLLVGSFKTEAEAIAGETVAKKILQNSPPPPPHIPTNEDINRWIAAKMSCPGL